MYLREYLNKGASPPRISPNPEGCAVRFVARLGLDQSFLGKMLLALVLALPCSAGAQGFPSKPIRLVVPYPAGGIMDTMGRNISQELREILGQQVLIDNRPGGNTTIGTVVVAKAPEDGYTLLLTTVIHYALPFFSRNVPYDSHKDFTPIAHLGAVPSAIAVSPAMEVTSIRELIDYAKKRPGKLFYGTPGSGSNLHLAGLLLAQTTGLDLEHVSYKGGGLALTDVMGGQLPIVILGAPTLLPHMRTGKLRVLGMVEANRSRGSPEIPAIGETIPGFAVPALWMGVLGPARLPRAIVDRMNAALRQSLKTVAVRQRLEAAGYDLTGEASPDEFAASIRADTEVFRKIVTTAGIQPE